MVEMIEFCEMKTLSNAMGSVIVCSGMQYSGIQIQPRDLMMLCSLYNPFAFARYIKRQGAQHVLISKVPDTWVHYDLPKFVIPM